MREISRENFSNMNFLEWEISNFTEMKIPEHILELKDYENNQAFDTMNITLMKRIPNTTVLLNFSQYDIQSDMDKQLHDRCLVQMKINPTNEETHGIFYKSDLYLCTIDEMKMISTNLKKYIKSFDELDEKLCEFTHSFSYRKREPFMDEIIINDYKILKEMQDKLESCRIEKIRKSQPEEEEGFKVFKKQFETTNQCLIGKIHFTKNIIKINPNEENQIDIYFIEDLSTLELYHMMEIKDSTHSKHVHHINNCIMNKNFILKFGIKGKMHTIQQTYNPDTGKVKIKHAKTHTWARKSPLHYEVINLNEISSSVIVLEFYENLNKSVAEYYSTLEIDIGLNVKKTIPITVTKSRDNKEKNTLYDIRISDDISFQDSIFLPNIKKDAFERLKQHNFTLYIELNTIYSKMIEQGIPRGEALEKLKTVKSLLLI